MCWGGGTNHRLGNGSTAGQNRPVSVQDISTSIDIFAGGAHSCALLQGGTVRCWGADFYGQIGDSAFDVGDKLRPTAVHAMSTAVRVAGGAHYSCAGLSNTGVHCWGRNTKGQLGNGQATGRHRPDDVTGLTGSADLDGGSEHACTVLSNGGVRCWGEGDNGRLGRGSTADSNRQVSVSGITNASSVSAGGAHSCAVLSDGSVRCWGAGQTAD